MDYEDESLSRLFEDYLHDNEKIVWTGKPMNKNIFSLSDVSLLPWTDTTWRFSYLRIFELKFLPFGGVRYLFLVPILLVSFFYLSLLLLVQPKDRVGYAIVLFAYLLMIFSLCSCLGLFLYRNWKRRNSYYALTNERVFVLTNGRKRSIKSEWIAAIPKTQKFVSPNGSGTIVFDNAAYSPSLMELFREYIYHPFNPFNIPYIYSLLLKKEPLIFQDIENVEKVYDLIEKLRDGNLQDGSFR